jgi:hypothetical protein
MPKEREGDPSAKESNEPAKEVPRTNTGVDLDNPEEMEEEQ